MIPRAELFAVAEDTGLLPTTVEKDYVLGWVLFGIARHPMLARWLFKGGTCLKKCYFDTYRFSEDLDFTIPSGVPYDADTIRNGLLRWEPGWPRRRVSSCHRTDSKWRSPSTNAASERSW